MVETEQIGVDRPPRPCPLDHGVEDIQGVETGRSMPWPPTARTEGQPAGTLQTRPCAGSSTDRASDYGSEGWGFESLPAREKEQVKKRCTTPEGVASSGPRATSRSRRRHPRRLKARGWSCVPLPLGRSTPGAGDGSTPVPSGARVPARTGRWACSALLSRHLRLRHLDAAAPAERPTRSASHLKSHSVLTPFRIAALPSHAAPECRCATHLHVESRTRQGAP